MTSLFHNPEQWYAVYEAASPKQRHQMLLEALEQPLSPEFLQATDFGGLLLEMRDELVNNNLLTETLALIGKFQQYQPELYAQEYAYFDKFLVEYYLYTNEGWAWNALIFAAKAVSVSSNSSASSLVQVANSYPQFPGKINPRCAI